MCDAVMSKFFFRNKRKIKYNAFMPPFHIILSMLLTKKTSNKNKNIFIHILEPFLKSWK